MTGIISEYQAQALKHQIKSTPLPSDAAQAAQNIAELISKDEHGNALAQEITSNPKLKALLEGIFGNSVFLTALILRNPSYFRDAINADPESYIQILKDELIKVMRPCDNHNQAMSALRIFKQKAALFIALTDLSGCWELKKTVDAITQTADTALEEAVLFLLKQAAQKGDYIPKDPNNLSIDCGLIILAMGKQGAHELNYSSDVDLIIFFEKQQLPLKQGIEPATFFVALTRNLVKLIQEYTADGYVFRVDLRLRPDPGATQIAISTDAAFAYYESFGQNWERAAMIKARPVAGDLKAGTNFLEGLAPFIWRKYLDFATIHDIHAMKRQIHTFKGHSTIAIEGHNLKLGRGGIREIEFFAQTQQLIAGGRQPELRTIKTHETLNMLAKNKWIKQDVCDDLTKAYQFLRRIEHRLQMLNDEQTHTLPSDESGMTRIANFSGFATIEAFSTALKQQLETVKRHYEDLFEESTPLSSPCGNLVFVGDAPDPETINTLKSLGFSEPEKVIETIRAWHFGRYVATRSERARERLTELQPHLIDALSKTSNPDYALATFDRFLKDLPAGVQLFSLLSNNPNLLRLIAEIMGTAPSLAHMLSRRTRVLDAVLDPGFFGDLPNEEQLHKLIQQHFVSCQDYQDTLDRTRIVGQEQAFLIGVRLLSGIINANQAAKGYTRLAESLIEELQAKVELELQEHHGSFEGAGISVLAMGKLGGREMTAASDLDLILIYDFEKGQTQSNGKKPLSPNQYYARLTQRLISALSAPTAEGELYEVDMRLRPSGRAGPVATHIDSFIDYQHNSAWVWEHMALTRARPITGPKRLTDRLNQTIKDVLSKSRDASSLAADVIKMREKISQAKGTDNIWDIKQVPGGQVDLEFICQYLQLYHAHKNPEILKTNSLDCFQAIKTANLLPTEQITKLIDAVKTYDSLIQMIRLCTERGFDPSTASEGLKQRLSETLNLPSFSILTETLTLTEQQIKAIFNQHLSKQLKNSDG